MGSKIPEARLGSGNRVAATDYENKPYGALFCASPSCSAQLSFVKRHDRKYATKTVEIAPCFRLKRNEEHSAKCKYNIGGQLNIIAKSSDSAVFSAIEKSKYEFRLHILLKALWELSKPEIENKGKAWGSSGESDKKYSNKGKLTNYLKTLKQILQLRALCEDNKELKSLVTLNYRGKKVSWERFYFDHENLHNFVKHYKVGEYTMPLAISGHIHELRKPMNEKFPFHVVELNSPFVEPDKNGVIKKPIPQIILKNSSLLKYIDPSKEYIFFGRWKPRERKRSGRNENSKMQWVFENIEMYIDNRDHFIEC
ncbi:hypothetical protein ACFD7L_004316 [Vibrio vulnificus]